MELLSTWEALLARERPPEGGGRARVRPETAIPILYALLTSTWIGFSDVFVATAVDTPQQHAVWSVVKGLGFTFATALVLRAGLRWACSRQRLAERRALARESILRAVTDALPEPVFVKDLAGRIVFANPATLATFGRSAREVVGSTNLALQPADLAEAMVANDRRVLASGRPEAVEEWVQTPAGRRLHLTTKSPFRDAGGQTVGLVGVARDITERKRIEDAVRASEERFRALIEKSTDLIVVLDAAGQASFCSQGASAILGIAPEALLGRRLLDLVHPEDREPLAELLRRLTPGAVAQQSVRLRREDGAWREIEVSVRDLLRDAAVGGVVVNGRDVTGQRLLEAQLRQAQRLESLGRVAGGVAHDFNNLLSAILSCSAALKQGLASGTGARAEDVEDILVAGERARELTRQILAVGRRQAPAQVDLNAVVLGARSLLLRLVGDGIRLRLDLAPAPWPLRIDPGQLERILVNLVVNARDAMPGQGTIELATRNESVPAGSGREPGAGDWMVLAIRDSGAGMTPEVQARIFEPFFTTKEHRGGTGLGLATVQRIVQQASGRLRVESAPGRGTTFEIHLPRAEPDPTGPS